MSWKIGVLDPTRITLAQRLLMVSLAGLLVLAGVAGTLLREALHEAVEQSLKYQIQEHIDDLVAEAPWQIPESDITRPGSDFERIFSGWYWQLSQPGRVLSSRSLWDATFTPSPRPADDGWHTAIGPLDEPLLGRAVAIPTAQGGGVLWVYVDQSGVIADQQRLDRLLAFSGVLAAALLLLMTLLQVRVGLRPLRDLNTALWSVHGGQAARLPTDQPPDLAPLAEAINAVLDRQSAFMDRARHQAEDLGHALKTPLTLMNLALAKQPPDVAALRQHQQALTQAITQAVSRLSSAGEDLSPVSLVDVLKGLLPLMRDLHRDRGVQWQWAEEGVTPGAAIWRGNAADVEEMLGNLLDNAGKWARQQVTVTLTQRPGAHVIAIDDDGPGLPPDLRATVLERGTRLDERVPGDGLGLTIVRNLAAAHGGHLELRESASGGLGADLVLPDRVL